MHTKVYIFFAPMQLFRYTVETLSTLFLFYYSYMPVSIIITSSTSSLNLVKKTQRFRKKSVLTHCTHFESTPRQQKDGGSIPLAFTLLEEKNYFLTLPTFPFYRFTIMLCFYLWREEAKQSNLYDYKKVFLRAVAIAHVIFALLCTQHNPYCSFQGFLFWLLR